MLVQFQEKCKKKDAFLWEPNTDFEADVITQYIGNDGLFTTRSVISIDATIFLAIFNKFFIRQRRFVSHFKLVFGTVDLKRELQLKEVDHWLTNTFYSLKR